MNAADFDAQELEFISQREQFLEKSLAAFRLHSLEALPDLTGQSPVALAPVMIKDYRKISDKERIALHESYFGRWGAAHFLVMNPEIPSNDGFHPIIVMSRQLQDVLPLKYPVDHPMEGHPEAVRRFGKPDGTLKIYDLDKSPSEGYREQAETSEQFDAHNDGLGYAGAVESFILYTDCPPISGGYTYFQNIVLMALYLCRADPDAFAALFLPDALTAIRPRGKGAIKVATPVLFLNEKGDPQTFLRVNTGEYQMSWRPRCPALARAAKFLERQSEPFAPGSSFVNFSRKGAGCIGRNGFIVHGRTPFIDGSHVSEKRVLARKWFMTKPEHTEYKHVPGMHILERYAAIYPDRFMGEKLSGHWNFDPTLNVNLRKA